jgi:hypothetical protein
MGVMFTLASFPENVIPSSINSFITINSGACNSIMYLRISSLFEQVRVVFTATTPRLSVPCMALGPPRALLASANSESASLCRWLALV